MVWPFYLFSFWTSLAVWFTGYIGFRVAVLQATGFPVTSSSHPVSDSKMPTSPDSSFLATSFTVAVSINPPKYASFSRAWELDAASDFEFLLILLSVFPVAMNIPGLLDAIGLVAEDELVEIIEDKFVAVDNDFATILPSPFRSCILFTIVLGQLIKLEVEQIKKIAPFITWEITFGQNVCELMIGVNATNLNLGVQLDPVKQPIQSNCGGPWDMPHCGTSAFHYHLNHSLIILKDIQRSTGTRMYSVWRNVINVCWNDVGVLDWYEVMHVDNCRRVSPRLSLGSTCSVRYGMKDFNHQIPESESGNAVHA